MTAFAFDVIFLTLVNPGPNFIFNPVSEPPNFYHIYVLPEFWAWSSNSYTLDHIIIESFAVFGADPTHVPYNFKLKYVPATPTTPAAVEILPPGFTSTPIFYAMPPRTVPYWLPDL